MSVIASNSVNFVPIHQLLKNFTDIKPKGISEDQIEKISSKEILDTAELSTLNKANLNVQSNPIFADKPQIENNIEISSGVITQRGALKITQPQLDSRDISQNATSLSSFIMNEKEKAMSQQANQSKLNAMALI